MPVQSPGEENIRRVLLLLVTGLTSTRRRRTCERNTAHTILSLGNCAIRKTEQEPSITHSLSNSTTTSNQSGYQERRPCELTHSPSPVDASLVTREGESANSHTPPGNWNYFYQERRTCEEKYAPHGLIS